MTAGQSSWVTGFDSQATNIGSITPEPPFFRSFELYEVTHWGVQVISQEPYFFIEFKGTQAQAFFSRVTVTGPSVNLDAYTADVASFDQVSGVTRWQWFTPDLAVGVLPMPFLNGQQYTVEFFE